MAWFREAWVGGYGEYEELVIELSFRNLRSSQITKCVRKIWEAYLGSVDNTKELLAI